VSPNAQGSQEVWEVLKEWVKAGLSDMCPYQAGIYTPEYLCCCTV